MGNEISSTDVSKIHEAEEELVRKGVINCQVKFKNCRIDTTGLEKSIRKNAEGMDANANTGR